MRVLLRIDIQNDFCAGGSLAVPGGDEVVEEANRLALHGGYDLVVDSQDWHPPGHGSFASSHPGRSPFEVIELFGVTQVLWPDHCVQGRPGADHHPLLDHSKTDLTVRKGTDPRVDSYSAFFDNGRAARALHRFLGHATDLGPWLKERGASSIDIVGLALDYCVAYSARDALSLGFAPRVLAHACRAIGDPQETLAQLARDGVAIA